MSLETVRTALVAMLNSVPEVGMVHGYERYVREEGAMQALYLWTPAGDVPQLRGWQLKNSAIEERSLGMGRVLNKQTWQLRGYWALRDEAASQLAFDIKCEAIRAAFRADPTLGGVCTAEMFGKGTDGMQKLDAGPVLFCGVLCHSALLQCETWEHPT